MDIETLRFRAACLSGVRSFFDDKGYLEVDTPALARTLIPETCLEVFRTEYLVPFKTGVESVCPLYLTPSPEVYIKPLLASHQVSIFQLSKCYRNVESVGRIHSPEFTMLEFYTVRADYHDSMAITEELIRFLAERLFSSQGAGKNAGAGTCIADRPRWLDISFERLSMDEAFLAFAGFSLALCAETTDLAREATRLGLGSRTELQTWAWDDLYELILVHRVEPALAERGAVFITDYPAAVPCLAALKSENRYRADGSPFVWNTRERWELYIDGVELANCYTELADGQTVEATLASEQKIKQRDARVPHPSVEGFGATCSSLPPCSGVAMGFDRLVMVLAGKTSLDAVLPCPLATDRKKR